MVKKDKRRVALWQRANGIYQNTNWKRWQDASCRIYKPSSRAKEGRNKYEAWKDEQDKIKAQKADKTA